MMELRNRADSSCRNGRLQWLTERTTPGLVAEFTAFILHRKKWWLIPIVATLLLLSLIAGLSGTGAAPLMYTLF
jgi:hypothetical protein